MSFPRKRIVMLLNNPCVNDSRVIKEAESLAKGGFSVFILCYFSKSLPTVSKKNGVIYIRCGNLLDFKPLWLQKILSKKKFIPLRKITAPLRKITAPLRKITAPLRKITAPLRKITTPLRKITAPLRKMCKFLLLFLFSPAYALYFMDKHKIFVHYFLFKKVVIRLQPDFIHAHDLPLFFAGYKISQKTNSKLVLDSHEMGLFLSNPPKRIHRLLLQYIERKCITNADYVITVSSQIKKHFQDLYSLKNIEVIYNSPSLWDQKKCPTTIRKENAFSKEMPVVLFIGGISFGRGFFSLLNAIKILEGYTLICVGMINSRIQKNIEHAIDEMQIQNRFIFVPAKPQNELLSYISTANVSVIPYEKICLNHEYCMPNKLFESIFARVPLVASDAESLKDFIDTHQVGLTCDSSDPNKLAKAIRQVVEKKHLFEITDQKYNTLKKLYAWETQAKKLLSIYKTLTFET